MHEEIVPDSEPEREEQRQHLNERRTKRTRKRVIPEPTRSMSFVLSSSPEPDLRLPSPLTKKGSPKHSDTRSVISISDDTSYEAEIPVLKFHSATTNLSATQANPEPGPSRLPPPRKRSTPASNASGSGFTTGSGSLSSSDLSRFSYKPHQSLRDMIKKRGEREAEQIARFGPPEPLRRSKSAKGAAHRFTSYFTDDELSRVLKCVSCNNRWTVRKGATAKMRHIQSCAKKNGLDDGIIKRLIRAELEAPDEPIAQKKPKSPGVSNTLFEDTLEDTGKAKKKRKPVQRVTTLHNPVDNREAIRAKARSLLAPEIRELSQDQELVDLLERSDSRMDKIQMFDDPPPATQKFGRSRLGQQTSSAMLSDLSNGSPKMSTTSRLATTANGRRLNHFTGEEIEAGSPISINSSIDIPFERLSLGPLDFQDEGVQSDHGTEVSWHNDSAILHYNQRDDDLDWDNNDFVHDDAILHFNSGERERSPARRPSPQPETLRDPTCIPSTPLDLAAPTPQVPVEQQVKGRKAAKPRSRKQQKDVQANDPTQSTEVSDTELKSKLLDTIRKDDELYHRILRYEPIPLDEFIALAVMLEFPIRGLQSRVTRILDEQAVHFQAPTSGSRR